MHAAFYLLMITGAVGAYDVLYYHIYKLRLYKHDESMWENATHLIRALIFATLLLTVLHVGATGWLWLIYPLLLGCELANTISDVVLEPYSRRKIGGLPAMEYILHIVLSLITGAALASIIWGTYDLLGRPSTLYLRTLDVPAWMRMGAYSTVAISLGMFTFELIGFCRLFVKRRQPGQEPVAENIYTGTPAVR